MRVAGALSALASATAALLIAASAGAATRVVIVESEVEPATAAERLGVQQLIGELEADGYEVFVTPAADGDERIVLRSLPSAGGLAVTVETRATYAGHAETTRVVVNGDDAEAARSLALKTVEWLRGRGFEPQSVPLDGTAQPTIHTGLSLALLVHPGGFPSAFAPGISFRYRLGQINLEARGLLSSHETVRGPEGTASLEQALLLGGVSLAPPLEDGWAPFLGAVAGGYLLEGEGRAVPGLASRRAARWSLAAGVGAGVRIQTYRGERIGVELYGGMDALWVVPQPVVRFVGQPVASGGQPLFVVSSGVELTFR